MAEPARQLPEDRTLIDSLQRSEFERAKMQSRRTTAAKNSGAAESTQDSNIVPFPGNRQSVEQSDVSEDSPALGPRATERELTEAAIDRQTKTRDRATQDAQQFREKYDTRKDQQGGFKNALDRARLSKKEKTAAKAEKGLQSLKKLQALQQGSATALRSAWLGLIPSWGLSWFYIAFHYVMAYFTPLSILFVKFGEEWLPPGLKASGGDAAKTAGRALEIPESGACIGIGCCFLLLLGLVFIIIGVIAYVYNNPLDALTKAFPYVSWRVIKCFGGFVFGVGSCG